MNQADYYIYNVGTEWMLETEHGLFSFANIELVFDEIRRLENERTEER